MLIEIRIGPGKRKISNWIAHLTRKCQIPLNKIHRVPHITLFGNFNANYTQAEKIKTILESTGKKYPSLPFLIDGLNCIEGEKGYVVFFNIVPSEELSQFRQDLTNKLSSIVQSTKPYDYDNNFLYHSTLAYKLTESELERIRSYVNSAIDADDDEFTIPYFYLSMSALRITLLNDRARIICEYDFLQKRLLSRDDALNRYQWQKTSRIFRIQRGMEGYRENTNSIYLISDLHLGHSNIIHYCARPFVAFDAKEMNSVLVENWNNVVHRHNTVYCLGDLSLSRRENSTEYWLSKLNGNILYIKGNHEEGVKNSKDYEILHHQQYKFLLIHNPDERPIPWNGWIIHGHKHNNDMNNFPFINGDKKTINVSAEMVNYRPVNLDFILSINIDSIERMDTIDSNPLRK